MTASDDLLKGWTELEEAQEAYETALDYFRGTAAERFANEKIRSLVEQADQDHQFRLAAIPVKVMAKRCRIADVTADSEAVKTRLAEIRQANQAELYEALLIRKTFIFGDAFALSWPVELEEAARTPEDGEDVDAAASVDVAAVGVEISYQSPLHCRVIYDGEDGRRPLFAIRRWEEKSPLGEGQSRWRAEVHYADRVEPWVTRAGASGGSAEDWWPYAEDEDGQEVRAEEGANWPLENPWGELAIKHSRTDMPYGEPAHVAAYAPQDIITKAVTTQFVGIESYGFPERWRILRDAKLLESGQEPVAWRDAADAPPADEQAGGRRRGPGTEHTYSGTEQVGQFTPPEPGGLMGSVDQWLRLMSVVTETPLDELDPTVQLSGISREKADAPMKAKERDAKAYLSAFFVDLYGLAVRQTGLDPGTISVTWAPPDVTMDGDWWTTAKVRRDMGVPTEQIMAEANYLPDQIKEWLDNVGEEMVLLQRVEILERIAAVGQQLGVAMQTGVVDQSTVTALMGSLVREATQSGGQER